jgi:hypothetical protein
VRGKRIRRVGAAPAKDDGDRGQNDRNADPLPSSTLPLTATTSTPDVEGLQSSVTGVTARQDPHRSEGRADA